MHTESPTARFDGPAELKKVSAVLAWENSVNNMQQATAEFLNQERIDSAVRTALPLDSDDLEFLKRHVDGMALSFEIIFSKGGWWLPQTDGTGHLVDAVMVNRRDR